VDRFLHVQAASGVLLMAATLVAMVWANSRWAHLYTELWHTPVVLGVGSFISTRDLHFWVNDGLMVIFFFVVGLEIRREVHGGELSELKRAALPMAAALGGMVVPAGLYLAVAGQIPEARSGWGVPMATDIAFAVGILALLGRRVPPAMRVLLLALAIMDDIGAILVIAVFYSDGVQVAGLLVAGVGVAAVAIMQWAGVRSPAAYVAPGLVVWTGMLTAGIHPTIAGVIMGLLTPAVPWFGPEGLLEEAGRALNTVEREPAGGDTRTLQDAVRRIGVAQREALPPVIRLEAALHPWVAFLIMPIFALANAGVPLGGMDSGTTGSTQLAVGVVLGLVVGKPLGIVLASLLAVKLRLATLPRGVHWQGLLVLGCVGGVGFTMALFIASLGFTEEAQLGVAKLAVLVGSALAACLGLGLGVLLLPREHSVDAAATGEEAERSTEG